MEFIKCRDGEVKSVLEFYSKVLKNLEATINYPKWSEDHPSRESTMEAISKGDQYACLENGRIVGAAVLNEDPEGDYDAGEWGTDLKRGEYLVLHVLAVDPSMKHKGIGSFMVENCIRIAEEKGYKAVRLDAVPFVKTIHSAESVNPILS